MPTGEGRRADRSEQAIEAALQDENLADVDELIHG